MNNILAIYKKELRAYFVSPIAYIVVGMFLLISSYLFIHILYYMQNYPQASFEVFFLNIQFTLFLMAPVLTMRSFSEEKRSGTIELLMTAPVTETQVVLGKFFAVMTLYFAMIIVTIQYPLILAYYGNPDLGAILSGYLGLLLLGAAFLSVGMLTSSFTKNQIVAAVIGLSFLLIIMLLSAAKIFAQTAWVKEFFDYISISEHFDNFTSGIIDTKSIIYFFSFTILFLFLTVRSLETDKWK